MRFSSNADSCCSRLKQSTHSIIQIMTQIEPVEFVPLALFCYQKGISPIRPPPILILSPSMASESFILLRKNPKTRFFQAISHPYPSHPPVFSPHAIPMKISHKIGAGRVESPAFLKKIKPVLEKLLSNAAELDVCPGKCRKWSMAGERPLPFRCRIFSG